MKRTRNQWHITLFVILSVAFVAPKTVGQTGIPNDLASVNDLLVYTVYDYDRGTSLLLYDPLLDESTVLYETDGRIGFEFCPNGYIIFSLRNGENTGIYDLDTQRSDKPPQLFELPGFPLGWSPDGHYLALSSQIGADIPRIYVWNGDTLIDVTPNTMSNTPESYQIAWSFDGRLAFTVWFESLSSDTDDPSEIYLWDGDTTESLSLPGFPLGWSPDGHYLALSSQEENDIPRIYIWNGDILKDITPDAMSNTPESYQIVWSFDGRLAFTVPYGSLSPDTDDPSEIYLWDGDTTESLSQNPTGRDESPSWNKAGNIEFLSERDGEYDILIWDGVSIKNGAPDADSFLNVAPGLIAYYSFPAWTPEGELTFISQTAQDSHAQIYLWDGETVTNISQNPDFHNGSPRWNNDGLWAFATFFSSKQLLYVRDAENRTILTTEGYSPAWSLDGNLIFCRQGTPSGWDLFNWNGKDIIEIIHSAEIQAQWQSGQTVVCSSG